MNRIPIYVGLIGGSAALLNVYRSWPPGVPVAGEFLYSGCVEVLSGFGFAALIAWFVTRKRDGGYR